MHKYDFFKNMLVNFLIFFYFWRLTLIFEKVNVCLNLQKLKKKLVINNSLITLDFFFKDILILKKNSQQIEKKIRLKIEKKSNLRKKKQIKIFLPFK